MKILIVRTDRIGDVVLSLPLTKIIKKNYPDSRLYFLLRNYTLELVEDHPYVDDIIILEERNGKILFFENLKKIREHSFDKCIVVNPTFKISLLLFFSGIKTRIGTGYRWYSILFNKKIYEHRKYGTKHELEFNLNMLKLIGIQEIDSSDVTFDITVGKSAVQNVVNILKRKSVSRDKKIIIIHPGSGGSAVDLPPGKFRELVRKLSDESNSQLILSGSNSEKKLCDELELNDGIINLAGRLDLKELIALISISDILVANSTGPIHIAAALGKYVVGFYPKIPECSPVRWGPYTDKKFIFSPTIGCSNCSRKQCEALDCMNSIEVEAVKEKILEILKGSHDS